FNRPSWTLLGALSRALVGALFSLARDRASGRGRSGTLMADVRYRLLRMPATFAALSRFARRSMERERARLWFTIQTQSMWNCAVAGIPNFVYTDSTVLANLYFRHKDLGSLPAPGWLVLERAIYADAAKTFVMSEHVARSLIELYGIEPAKVARAYVGATCGRRPDRRSLCRQTTRRFSSSGSNGSARADRSSSKLSCACPSGTAMPGC